MMEIDPVCGMEIDPMAATDKSFYMGKTYYFCSTEDKMAFDKEPDCYVKSMQHREPNHATALGESCSTVVAQGIYYC